MSDWWNPAPSDYAGQFRLAALAGAAGLVLLLIGLAAGDGCVQGVVASAGVGLLVACGAIVLSARRSRGRAEQARKR